MCLKVQNDKKQIRHKRAHQELDNKIAYVWRSKENIEN